METLPPKYLKPIFVTGKTINIPSSSPLYQKYISMVQTVAGAAVTTSTEAFTTGTETFSAGAESYSAGAEAFTAGAESYAAEGGAEAFTAGAESYAAEGGAEAFTAGAESYAAEGGAEFGGDFTAGAEFGAGAEAGAEFGGEAFTGGEEFGAGAEAGAEFGGFEGAGASAGGDLSGYQLIRRGNGITQNEENKISQAAASVVQQGLTPLSNQTARAVKKVLGGDWLVIVYPQDKPIDFNMTCVQGNDYMYFTLNGNAYQVCRLV